MPLSAVSIKGYRSIRNLYRVIKTDGATGIEGLNLAGTYDGEHD